MIEFKHNEDNPIQAIGFESQKETLVCLISGIMAIISEEELTEKEELALLYSVYAQLPHKDSLFDSMSQEIEALYLIKPKTFYNQMYKFYKENGKELMEQAEKVLEVMNLS